MNPHVKRAGVYALMLLANVCQNHTFASPASGVHDTIAAFYSHSMLELSGHPIHAVDFIQSVQPLAIQEMNKYHIPASIILAQAILESGYGLSPLAQEANNFFGIKANRWNMTTFLYKGDRYRSYDGLYYSFDDHSQFLLEKPVFQNLVQRRDLSYTSWLYGLEATGYAEDPFYIVKLRDIIERFALYRLDELVPQSSS
ncbi:MAG: glucosaminidase domain-containing protein [Saprospiraceae bacterium]|nr:glucosaminidase domain-containing protein [Saprospiraceae bacterium]